LAYRPSPAPGRGRVGVGALSTTIEHFVPQVLHLQNRGIRSACRRVTQMLVDHFAHNDVVVALPDNRLCIPPRRSPRRGWAPRFHRPGTIVPTVSRSPALPACGTQAPGSYGPCPACSARTSSPSRRRPHLCHHPQSEHKAIRDHPQRRRLGIRVHLALPVILPSSSVPGSPSARA
jgi:hypothetical protein